MNYPMIAARVFNRPLAFSAAKLQVIMGVLGPRLGFEAPSLVADVGRAAEVRKFPNLAAREERAGIRTIEIGGSLVNRFAAADSGVVSYDEIRDSLASAVADSTVRGIMMRFDSFGGEVNGLWDLADEVRQAREIKPVWGSVDDAAYSAGFAIAAQVQRLYVTRTAGVGSVGIIAMHYDLSRYYEQAGVRPVAVFAGSHKNDFSTLAPLKDEALAWLQASVDQEWERFLEYVAGGRGLTAEAVRATQAAVYEGTQAIEIGFADVLGTFNQALSDFEAHLRSGAGQSTARAAAQQSQGGQRMADQQTAPAVDNNAGAGAERARIAAILNHPEASGRADLAQHLAFNTDMSPEHAAALLAKAPKAAAVAPAGSGFERQMAALGNPNVSAGAVSEASEETAAALVARMAKYGNALVGAKEVQ
jgi:capsid assembly protease